MTYSLPEPPVLIALATAGMFLTAMVVEFAISRLQGKGVYSAVDSMTNLTLYAGSLIVDFLWLPVVYAVNGVVHAHSLAKFGYQWWLFQGTTPLWHWLLLLIADDFCFYWFHRASHKIWILWASHENHHSSRRFNLSVAARQTWTPFLAFLFWLPLAVIGFDPLMILSMQLISLFYQALMHTELIRGFGVLDRVLNSPSHHRVHHGTNPRYLDKNFAGIFIVWDRLFHTFEREGEPAEFGTDKVHAGYAPIRTVSLEYVRLLKAAAAAPGWQRLKILFRTPGWGIND